MYRTKMKIGNSGMWNVIGYFVVAPIVVSIGLYIISLIFYQPNKVTEAIIHQYMMDTSILQDTVGKSPPLSDDTLGFQLKTYPLYLTRNGTMMRDYHTYTFYSYKYHKYIQLFSIIEGFSIVNEDIALNKILNITVNKEDYDNPAYGTKANPVPVFKFVGADTSIRADNKDYDTAYMDSVFHNNVKIYLQYIMPKKEFKARYGK